MLLEIRPMIFLAPKMAVLFGDTQMKKSTTAKPAVKAKSKTAAKPAPKATQRKK